MHSENINHAFLDPVVAGDQVDVYYHFGLSSADPVIERLRDVRAIVMAGSGARIDEFARTWSRMNGDAEITALPKEERFVTRYCAGVLFASHGMGMPSASIAVQELMRLVYFLKRGDRDNGYRGQTLYRRESHRIDDHPDKGGSVWPVLDGVKELKFEYWDDRKEVGEDAWTSDWDSDDNQMLPERVRITLVLERLEGQPIRFVTQAAPRIRLPISPLEN